jgi:hypothetical protein
MTQTVRFTAVAVAFMALFPHVGNTQGLPAHPPVDFHIQVWGDAANDFSARVTRYFDLRSRLADGLPAVMMTDDPREIRRGQQSLAKAIRLARLGAMEGEFFTLEAASEFKLVLAIVMTAKVWAVIMDDNPGEFRHAINASYPDGATRSTMPGVVLARLPRLPDGIEFRFLGRHLILFDVKANTIIDRLPYAIHCEDCDAVAIGPGTPPGASTDD